MRCRIPYLSLVRIKYNDTDVDEECCRDEKKRIILPIEDLSGTCSHPILSRRAV